MGKCKRAPARDRGQQAAPREVDACRTCGASVPASNRWRLCKVCQGLHRCKCCGAVERSCRGACAACHERARRAQRNNTHETHMHRESLCDPARLARIDLYRLRASAGLPLFEGPPS